MTKLDPVASGTKKLERRYAEHLAGILRPIVRERFDDNQTAFAKAAGVSQSQVSSIMKSGGGDRSVGISVLIRLREYLGNLTIDEMLGLPPLRHRATPPVVITAQAAPVAAMDLEAAIQRALDRKFPDETTRPPSPVTPRPKQKKPE
jgi:transcriptional regulator with XRE-family HTH domain